MKQFISFLVLFLLTIALVLNQVLPADAARSAKKKGVSQEELDEITASTDVLIKKIYERELYTPEDSKNLIALKLKLDSRMDILPEASFAPIYYKLGTIFKMRGLDKEAINCFQTVLENFVDTAYGPKSRDVLTSMGIEIKLPEDSSEEDEEF